MFSVAIFYVANDGGRHALKDPVVIPAPEFAGYRAVARDIIDGLLAADDRPDGSQAVVLEITDPTGKLVFACSTGTRPHLA